MMTISTVQHFQALAEHFTGFTLITNLVGGLEHFLFFHILGIILPIDYFSEGLKPPTSNVTERFPVEFPLNHPIAWC